MSINSLNKNGLIIRVVLIAVIAGVIGGFVSSQPAVYIKGIAFGTLFSILKLHLMERTLRKAVNMSPERANHYAVLHYSLRYILTGVVLIVAALEPSIDLIGTIIGIISIKLSAFSFMYKSNEIKQ